MIYGGSQPSRGRRFQRRVLRTLSLPAPAAARTRLLVAPNQAVLELFVNLAVPHTLRAIFLEDKTVPNLPLIPQLFEYATWHIVDTQ